MRFFKLTIKQAKQDTINEIVPMNNPEDVVALGNRILNLRSDETEPVITLEYISEDEVIKLNDKKNKENVQYTEDEFGNKAVVQPPKNDTNVDANNVVAVTESFGREDEDGNPTGTKLSAKEQATKQANLEKQEKAKAKTAKEAKQGE